MGKCIVCSKSAGPFYSLHKACLPLYRDTQSRVENEVANYKSSDPDELITAIQSYRPSEGFSEFYFKKFFLKAWQKQAEPVVKSASLDVRAAKRLLYIARKLGINSNDLENNFLSRLENIEYLEQLQKKLPLNKSFENIPKEIELEQDEFVVWHFSEMEKSEQKSTPPKKQWTILNSLMDNMLMKSRYKTMEVIIEDSGQLTITNRSLFYKSKNTIKQIKFTEIHSITPMKEGVRVQPLLPGASSDTYLTGDGRFTYALLKYAQGQDI